MAPLTVNIKSDVLYTKHPSREFMELKQRIKLPEHQYRIMTNNKITLDV